MLEKITESGLDKWMATAERWSVVMAWAAVAGAIIFILLPALWTVWGR